MAKLASLAINDEGFVFDPTSGNSYQVSATGLRVLRGLRDGHDEQRIAQSLVDDFEVDLDDARRDVADFINRLKHLELV